MTDNVIEFKKPEKTLDHYSDLMFELYMYMNQDGQYEVEMEQFNDFSEFEIYLALEAIAAKYGMDHGFLIESEE